MADLTDADLRRIFAEELEREGEPGLARYVRAGSDTSRGGLAAVAALKRVRDYYKRE